MARKRYKPEEIVAKLRQVDVLVSQGQNMLDAIRQIKIADNTTYKQLGSVPDGSRAALAASTTSSRSAGPLDRVAQMAERKYCRPHA